MRLAYIVLAYIDPEHIARLCNKVTAGTENHAFVHIDAKVDISPFVKACEGLPQVHFLQKRKPISWGGFHSVEATVETFREALNYGEFDYFQILQGLDYPIVSNRKISSFFKENYGREMIRAIDDTVATKPIDKLRYCLYWNFDGKDLFSFLLKKFNVFQFKVFKHTLTVRKPYLVVNKKPYHIYRGWAHFALSRAAAEYCVKFYDTQAEFNRYFKYVYSSDESYFHTIIFNSPFAERVIDGGPIAQENRSYQAYLNQTYFEYPKEGVVLFTKAQDYEQLCKTGYLFFRKASSKSKQLLDYIDAKHLQEYKGDGTA